MSCHMPWHHDARVPSVRLCCKSWEHIEILSLSGVSLACIPPPPCWTETIVSEARLCSTLYIQHAKSSSNLFRTRSQFSYRKSGLTGSCFHLLKMTRAAKFTTFWSRLTSVWPRTFHTHNSTPRDLLWGSASSFGRRVWKVLGLADATPYNRAVAKFA